MEIIVDADFEKFRDFFSSQKPPSQAYFADISKEDSHLFATSLDSSKHLMKWTHGATNAFGRSFNIIPGFLESMIPNAIADKDETNHFVAMNVALFVSITEFSMFAFAQKNFFPQIGDAHLEKSSKSLDGQAPGIWLLNHTKEGKHVDDSHSEHLIPKCSIRYETSIYLSFIMARFVWLHELSHCFNGHVEFAHDKKLAVRLYELSEGLLIVGINDEDRKKKYKTLQLLEYEADRSALWGSLSIQTNNLENVEGIRILDEETRLKLSIFGAYAMTWLFEEYQAYQDTKNDGGHPTPHLRLQNLFQIAKNDLPKRINKFTEINEDVCLTFDAVRQSIPNIYGSSDMFRDMESGHYQEHFSKIKTETEKIQKELEPYAYKEIR